MDRRLAKGRSRGSGTMKDHDSLNGEGSGGVLRQFWSFTIHNKKWWLAPVIVLLLLLGLLVALGTSGAAPFIYTLF
jgi:hypothetical protein